MHHMKIIELGLSKDLISLEPEPVSFGHLASKNPKERQVGLQVASFKLTSKLLFTLTDCMNLGAHIVTSSFKSASLYLETASSTKFSTVHELFH